jgi:transposase
MREYGEAMKSKMVQRMLGPEKRSVYALSVETGISKSSLFKWRDKGKLTGMLKKENQESPLQARRPEDWTAAEKLDAVVAASQLSENELGIFLRKKGLHEAHVAQWRESVLGALGSVKLPRGATEQRRIRDLERELQRKDKALAETAALLVLQKKVREIWGAGDESTDPENDK